MLPSQRPRVPSSGANCRRILRQIVATMQQDLCHAGWVVPAEAFRLVDRRSRRRRQQQDHELYTAKTAIQRSLQPAVEKLEARLLRDACCDCDDGTSNVASASPKTEEEEAELRERQRISPWPRDPDADAFFREGPINRGRG